MATPNVKVDTGETAKYIVYGVVGVAVLAVAYFGIIKPILNAVGLTSSKEDRQTGNIQENLTEEAVLSPLLYNQNKNKVTITSAKANTSAVNIYEAKWGGTWGLSDKEEMAVGAITSAGSLVNVSYIASVFQNLYKKDLYTYLESFLENENWRSINDYLKKTKKF
jgi:hypothetical protein